MPRLMITPCRPCQKRHVKCDGKKPVCSRCKRLNKKCVSTGLTLRAARGLKFPRGQQWLTISKPSIQFVDESPDLANHYGHRLQSKFSRPLIQESDTLDKDILSRNALSDIYSPSPSDATIYDEGPRRPSSSDHAHISHHNLDTSSPFSNTSPYHDFREAFLMRYFLEELAQWFDSCDAARHFELIVPQRAAECPALLYAIFSTSARHLSRHQPDHAQPYASSFELVDAALEYQNLCISHLISLSGDSTEVQDENLLAATVILRFYEEIETPLAGVDEETYLREIQVFLEAQAATAVYDSGLQCAAFWIGCRQEFHTAFSNQRSFRFDLRCCEDSIYRTLDPANDDTWANRVILHCADALMYCYGEETQSQKRFEELWEYNEEWHARKPSSFSPMYYQPSDRRSGAIFPEIWYLDDRKVTAIQHWLLARILLEVFDPRIPRLGPRQRAASTIREAEIKSNVFELCGIGLSKKTAPALITSCMGVSMCGDRITDVAEQAALLRLLEKTEKRHSLSTEKIKLQLKEAWVLEELERTK